MCLNLFLSKLALLVTWSRFWISHARPYGCSSGGLTKCGTLWTVPVEAASFILSVSVLVGTCGTLPHPDRSHSCFGELFKYGRGWASWPCYGMARCCLSIRYDTAGSTPSRWPAKRRWIATFWTEHGSRWVLGARHTFLWHFLRDNYYCFVSFVHCCGFDSPIAYLAYRSSEEIDWLSENGCFADSQTASQLQCGPLAVHNSSVTEEKCQWGAWGEQTACFSICRLGLLPADQCSLVRVVVFIHQSIR